mmetsp:Transcript_23240/g.58729  ORF Transcript_23240/g.58729 Transcript_23240/m.58729 type:complete len:332 (-) Transcript_23240:347-1342(-)
MISKSSSSSAVLHARRMLLPSSTSWFEIALVIGVCPFLFTFVLSVSEKPYFFTSTSATSPNPHWNATCSRLLPLMPRYVWIWLVRGDTVTPRSSVSPFRISMAATRHSSSCFAFASNACSKTSVVLPSRSASLENSSSRAPLRCCICFTAPDTSKFPSPTLSTFGTPRPAPESREMPVTREGANNGTDFVNAPLLRASSIRCNPRLIRASATHRSFTRVAVPHCPGAQQGSCRASVYTFTMKVWHPAVVYVMSTALRMLAVLARWLSGSKLMPSEPSLPFSRRFTLPGEKTARGSASLPPVPGFARWRAQIKSWPRESGRWRDLKRRQNGM